MFDKVLYTGLGKAVDITLSNEPVAEATESSSAVSKSGMHPEKIGNLKEVKIILHKLELAKLDQSVFITQRFMDELPKSKYRSVDYLVK